MESPSFRDWDEIPKSFNQILNTILFNIFLQQSDRIFKINFEHFIIWDFYLLQNYEKSNKTLN